LVEIWSLVLKVDGNYSYSVSTLRNPALMVLQSIGKMMLFEFSGKTPL